jgi:hypothetical protein
LESQDYLTISITDKNIDKWMSSLANRIADKPINQIFMPGTHDSGTYKITPASPVTADAATSIAIAQNYGGQFTQGFDAGWAKTQYNTVLNQLNNGIRYFDLRLCGKGSDVDTMYTCHALQGDSLKDIVSQVKEFLRQENHQHEIIILDVNHWYNHDERVLPEMQVNALNYINDQLFPWIAPRKDMAGIDQYTPNSKLNSFWNNKKQVIVSSTVVPPAAQFNYVWRSVNSKFFSDCIPVTDICSYWPNKQDPEELKKSMTQTLQTLHEAPQPHIFILQTQLTQSAKVIGWALTLSSPNNLFSWTGTYKDDVSDFLNQNSMLREVNGAVIIEDFSNGIDLTLQAWKLNGGS